MSEWPERINLKKSRDSFESCGIIGYNQAHSECSQAAIKAIVRVRNNIINNCELSNESEQFINNQINDLIEQIRAKF